MQSFKYIFIYFLIPYVLTIEDLKHWKRLAENDIHEALEYKRNTNKAKNIILFIGDGMDLNTVTASRIYKKGEEKYFAFEKFPNIALLKTYSADKLVPDSCSTASAIFSGIKVNHRTAGVDPAVEYNNCEATLKPENRLKTILNWAQDAGKSTGFVTTTRVTHATPSALYAHVPNRHWECESKIPENGRKCKDIARQLIEDIPGRNINVIFGGGRQCLISDVKNERTDPIDNWACYSKDGRNLIHNWEQEKQHRTVSHTFVQTRTELLNLDTDSNDYVLGIFANSHLYMRNDNGTLNVANPRPNQEQPSLREMTETAVKVLEKNRDGYFLMVEGGLIDYAHHRGHARSALEETAELSQAIDGTLKLIKDYAEDTLVIVTSDHTHSLVFVGYANRSQGVLGVAQPSKWDGIPYTTLLYGTGGPNNYQFETVNGTVKRSDPRRQNTTNFEYSQQTGVVTDETVHGGSDVVVYAKGPMAHLFNTVHEQTYVAYVMAYAARIGPYSDREFTKNSNEFATPKIQYTTILTMLLITVAMVLLLF